METTKNQIITHAQVRFPNKSIQVVQASKLRLIPKIKGEKLKTITFKNKTDFSKEGNVYACELFRCPENCKKSHDKHYGFVTIFLKALGGKANKKNLQPVCVNTT